MADPALKIAFWDYDITRPLLDGRVSIDGVDAEVSTAQIVTEIFEPMVREHAFDVAELGWTYFLRLMEQDDPPFLALPVFPARRFHHSAIFVNTRAGIAAPRDLAGKRIGEFALYGHDSGFWPKGMLADEYGVDLSGASWVIGGLDFPMTPVDYVPERVPAGVEVTHAPEGTDLGELLERGEIDALISADVPKSLRDGSPEVAMLFPDAREREREYYARTGILPMIHTLVVQRQLATEHPELITPIYEAFRTARDTAVDADQFARVFNHVRSIHPWTSGLYDEDRAIFGDDWWQYGLAANRRTIDTLLRYHHEQGLTRRLLSAEEIFVPALLGS